MLTSPEGSFRTRVAFESRQRMQSPCATTVSGFSLLALAVSFDEVIVLIGGCGCGLEDGCGSAADVEDSTVVAAPTCLLCDAEVGKVRAVTLRCGGIVDAISACPAAIAARALR